MSLAVVIMAAGQSQRFGGCKLLAELNGKAVLQHSVEVAETLDNADIFIVTGRWHAEIIAAQQQGQVSPAIPCWFNPRWQEGLGQSLSFAFHKLGDDYAKVLVMLGDQVKVTHVDIQQLLAAQQAQQLSCAVYAGKPGVPALFDASCFTVLRNLSGDRGAKALLSSGEFRVGQVDMPNAAFDIDTPEQLTALSNLGKT